jgi:hypothetical protein
VGERLIACGRASYAQWFLALTRSRFLARPAPIPWFDTPNSPDQLSVTPRWRCTKQLAGRGYGLVINAIGVLLDACKETGAGAPGPRSARGALLVGFLWRIETDDSWTARTARMRDLVMEGPFVTERIST